jgi:hypothetical protein
MSPRDELLTAHHKGMFRNSPLVGVALRAFGHLELVIVRFFGSCDELRQF